MKYARGTRNSRTAYGLLRNGEFRLLNAAPWHDGTETGEVWSTEETTWLAPCEPRKIVGIAMNYPGVSGEFAEMKEPLVFLKPPTSVLGPEAEIRSPFAGAKIWGEPELALVVGKTLSPTGGMTGGKAIFGYTVANDVSARNLHDWDHHLVRAKGADTFCPLGPWIETDFEPESATIEGLQNGTLLRVGLARDRKWPDLALLRLISSWMTLEPGDVILTGSPPRTGEKRYLMPGDVFTCRIGGLGELSNRLAR